MSNPASQHVVNAIAVAAPVVAKAMDLPTAITIVLGLLGIVWYAIQIGEWAVRRVKQMRQTRESAHRVALKLNDERHPPDAPSAD